MGLEEREDGNDEMLAMLLFVREGGGMVAWWGCEVFVLRLDGSTYEREDT